MTLYAVYLDNGRSIHVDKDSWVAVQEAMANRHPIVTIKDENGATWAINPSYIIAAIKWGKDQ